MANRYLTSFHCWNNLLLYPMNILCGKMWEGECNNKHSDHDYHRLRLERNWICVRGNERELNLSVWTEFNCDPNKPPALSNLFIRIDNDEPTWPRAPLYYKVVWCSPPVPPHSTSLHFPFPQQSMATTMRLHYSTQRTPPSVIEALCIFFCEYNTQ